MLQFIFFACCSHSPLFCVCYLRCPVSCGVCSRQNNWTFLISSFGASHSCVRMSPPSASSSSSDKSDNQKALQDVYKVVLGFLSRPEADPFRSPVDWKGMGLTDYPLIVKRPMDLGTVKSKLDKKAYSNLAAAAADIRLVWMNCMTYNQDGSEFYQLADSFSRQFEETYAELREKYGLDASDPDRVPSMDEKIKLSYDIFKIDNTDLVSLGKLVNMVEKKCPRAVEREGAEVSQGGSNETLLNVDGLTPRCFHEVAKYIQTCLTNGASKPGTAPGKRKKGEISETPNKKSKQ